MDTTQYFPVLGFLTAWMVLAIGGYLMLLGLTKWGLPGRKMVARKQNVVTVIGAAVVIFALMGGAWNEIMPAQAPAAEPGTGPVAGQVGACPSTGYTSVKMDVQNNINVASLEEYDVGITCVGPGDTVAIADTTDPASGSNFVCGDTYTCYITSTAGAAGDGSYVQAIKAGSGSIVNGQLVFTASGAAQSFQLAVDQIGVTEARMWDVKNAAWIYDGSDASAVDYETDGATFKSTTNNATAMAVGTQGEVHVALSFRSTAIDNALQDGRGLLIAFDGDVTKWAIPTMMLDGASLPDCKGSLDASEALALNAYEHVYCASGAKTFAQNGEGILDMQVFALAGVDPGGSDDLQIDMIPRGQKASSLDASKFVQSAYDNTASHTVILQVDDYTLDIS